MAELQTQDEIIALEKRFWQALVDRDADGAAQMIAENALSVHAGGTMTMDPAKYRGMVEDAKWQLATFTFSDLAVVYPAEDTAVIAYKVHQTGSMGGKPMDMTCADSTTWVRQGGDWKCALHTETVLAQD